MGKQLYLNLFQSKWIWYLGISTILINLLMALSLSDYRGSLMPFINVLNVIAVVYTTSAYLNIHYMLKSDDSHYFYFSLPNTKRNIIRGDYIYYMVMMVLTAAIFGSYMAITQETYYLYGFMMLMGVSLIVMSLYYLGYGKYWLRYLSTGYVIYGVPMLMTLLFHFMPLVNVNQLDRRMPGMDFYLYELPIYTLAVGIVLFIISYAITQRNITKHDMV
ncbi:ABC-2 transporter permease [Salinicoccus luteus]|uniref:ABC-2 transporter permease n=1 Tax=Salinicoccus luteus TaxID=367840 RepID=UPI0004E164CD|nr:ABC-2 transporter permease [Salinicoccus luteus]